MKITWNLILEGIHIVCNVLSSWNPQFLCDTNIGHISWVSVSIFFGYKYENNIIQTQIHNDLFCAEINIYPFSSNIYIPKSSSPIPIE